MAGDQGTVSENLREIIRQLNESQDKYTYFLLAAAGSCIALSVSRTTGVAPTWPMFLLGAAVVSWAWSIWQGVQNRRYHQAILYANADLLKVAAGTHPEVGQHPAAIEAAAQGILKAMTANIEKAASFAIWQLYLLLTGAGFFLLWHVIDMFVNSHPTSASSSIN
jgi:hypothetical protein